MGKDKIKHYADVEKYRRLHPWSDTFRNAKRRCSRKKDRAYKKYGGKGIKFLITLPELKDIWFRDKAYLMEKPSIDRIDSSGNYEFKNCRYIEHSLNSKLGNIQSVLVSKKAVAQFDKKHSLIKIFSSGREAAKAVGLCPASICRCACGKNKTAGGYIWKHHNKEKICGS